MKKYLALSPTSNFSEEGLLPRALPVGFTGLLVGRPVYRPFVWVYICNECVGVTPTQKNQLYASF
jgi:hypothetical protein